MRIQTTRLRSTHRPASLSLPRRVCCVLNETATSTPQRLSRTARLFQRFVAADETGGAGGQTTYESLRRADAAWGRMRRGEVEGEAPSFVTETVGALKFVRYDVVICGGTLGIFLACTLQQKGFRVAVVERGRLEGRQQEWNISRRELEELKKAGILSTEDLDSCICSEWEQVRAGFHEGTEVWTTDVLNIGVSPRHLIQQCRSRFQEAGGKVYEGQAIGGVELYNNGAQVHLTGEEGSSLTSRLVLDCMGHFSPIVRQSRHGQQPDGVCLVVGTCARGFTENNHSDLILTNGHIMKNKISGNRVQYFWEAFPAGSGPHDRTTYMFAYLDVTPQRPSLEDMFEDYWDLMPAYQGVQLDDLEFQRALFGFFPTYKDSPLRPRFDRVIHVGDAGGLQSPLSFGGFGAMLRHLERHTEAIAAALNANIVDKDSLSLINPYNPGLRTTWLFQRVMSAQEDTPPDLINEILSNNFKVMKLLGPNVMKPFLQDVARFSPLFLTLLLQLVVNPGFLITATQVFGVDSLVEWLPHFFRLGIYELGSLMAAPMRRTAALLPPRDMFKMQRCADALQYGSGADYDH